MRLSEIAWVEVDAAGNPQTIFRNHKQAILAGVAIAQMVYGVAVRIIRQAVLTRDGFCCTHCGRRVTLEGDIYTRGHMHERQWRGQGGLVSLSNSVTLCYSCHMNDPVAGHGNRKPQWGVKGPNV